MATTIRENVRGRIEELKTLRDEIRVELNLAGMGLRQEWQELEKRLPDPAQLARDLRNVTSEALDEIVEEARKFRLRLSASAAEAGTVAGLMTREVATCTPDTSLSEAARQMWRHDVGALPVLDHDGRVIGMVTDRDACMAAYTQGQTLDRIPVRTAMSKQVYKCGPDASPAEAENIMSKRQIRRLPVVDTGDKLLGVVTIGDLARAAKPSSDEVTATLAAIVSPRAEATQPGR